MRKAIAATDQENMRSYNKKLRLTTKGTEKPKSSAKREMNQYLPGLLRLIDKAECS